MERAVRAVGHNRVVVVTLLGPDERIEGYQWHVKGPASPGDWEAFANHLVGILQQQRRSLLGVQRDPAVDVGRLLKSGQVQMAFLAGVVELEGRLNRLLRPDLKSVSSRGRPVSLRSLLDLARRENLISISSEDIAKLTDGRNRVAHGQALSVRDLSTLAELVSSLLDELPGE